MTSGFDDVGLLLDLGKQPSQRIEAADFHGHLHAGRAVTLVGVRLQAGDIDMLVGQHCRDIAQQAGAAQARVDQLAVAFIVARLVYGAMYLANLAPLRSLVWAVGFGLTIAIFLAAR